MLFCKCPVNSLWFMLQLPCPITISKVFCKSQTFFLAPSCNRQMQKWGSPETSSQILSQFMWFNKYIKIEGTVIHFPKSSNKSINFLSQLFENGRIISSINLKDRDELTNNVFSVGLIETCHSSEMETNNFWLQWH